MDTPSLLERAAEIMQERGKVENSWEATDSKGRICIIEAMECASEETGNRLLYTREGGAFEQMTKFCGTCSGYTRNNDLPTVVAAFRAVAATLRARQMPVVLEEREPA